jgi:hypothetical protein
MIYLNNMGRTTNLQEIEDRDMKIVYALAELQNCYGALALYPEIQEKIKELMTNLEKI